MIICNYCKKNNANLNYKIKHIFKKDLDFCEECYKKLIEDLK